MLATGLHAGDLVTLYLLPPIQMPIIMVVFVALPRYTRTLDPLAGGVLGCASSALTPPLVEL